MLTFLLQLLWTLPFLLRSGWILPFLLQLLWILTLYTAGSVYAAYILRLGRVLPFHNALAVDAAFLMLLLSWVLPFTLPLDGDKALYLAVCGNRDL